MPICSARFKNPTARSECTEDAPVKPSSFDYRLNFKGAHTLSERRLAEPVSLHYRIMYYSAGCVGLFKATGLLSDISKTGRESLRAALPDREAGQPAAAFNEKQAALEVATMRVNAS
jgi:hypothetical protein